MTMGNLPEMKRGRARLTNMMGQATKTNILKACAEVISREGTANLSIENIAKKAGVTKGTLLYHFGNKETLYLELIRIYVAHLDERFAAGITVAKEKWPDHDPYVAGFVEWYRTFYLEPPAYTAYGFALLSAMTADETLREPVSAWYHNLFARLKESVLPDENAKIVVLALEGLFFLKHFQLSVLNAEETDRILDRLLGMADRKADDRR